MTKKEKWLNCALRIAKHTPPVAGESHAAILVWRNREIMAIGENQYKTHPLQKQYADKPEKIFIHAEIDALSKLPRIFHPRKTLTMYVARWKKGKVMLSKPCKGCMAALAAFNIQRVEWSETE